MWWQSGGRDGDEAKGEGHRIRATPKIRPMGRVQLSPFSRSLALAPMPTEVVLVDLESFSCSPKRRERQEKSGHSGNRYKRGVGWVISLIALPQLREEPVGWLKSGRGVLR